MHQPVLMKTFSTTPSEFNIERKPNRHLAFGTGPHQCLGLILARLEMRIFFQQLIPRIAEMEMVGDPERMSEPALSMV